MRMVIKMPSPNRVALVLCAIITVILLLSLLTVVLRYPWGITLGGRLLHMDEEANLPTWYSSITLVYSSFLAWLIAYSKKQIQAPFIRSWMLLGFAFYLMSADEFMQVHEALVRVVNRIGLFSDLGQNAWLVPGVIIVAVIALLVGRAWWDLPTYFKSIFFCSALVYFSGAIGIEIFDNIYGHQKGFESLGFSLFTHIEEVLEMMGVVILIKGLMEYLCTFSNEICFELNNNES